MAKRRLAAADIPLRRARRLQAVRRSVLALSALFILGLPFVHATAGAVADGRARVGLAVPPAVGAPWSVSVFGLELLDPLALAGLIAARAITLHVLLGALPVLVLVVALGRYFCSWMCPYAPLVGVSNASRALVAKLGVTLPDVKLPRQSALVVLAVVLVATAIGGAQIAALVYPPAILGRAAWKLATFGSAGAGVVVIGVAFLFDATVSRAGFCRSVCPGGAMFRLLSPASPVRVTRDAATCTSCDLCDTVCNMGESPMTDHVDAGCDRCGRCVSACPTGSLDLVAIARKPRTQSAQP